MATYTGSDKRLKYLFDHIGDGGGHVIEDGNGTEMTDRSGLQFVNATSVTDDPVNDRTVVTVLPFRLTGNTTDGFLPLYGDEV